MDRDFILSEIRRAAVENGGGPLGRAKFQELTGITEGVWRGKYWLSWGDAAAAAGVQAGQKNEAHEEDYLLARLAELTRQCGHFPTLAEKRMQRTLDKTFPNDKVFDRFGAKDERIAALRTFAAQRPEFADVAALLPQQSVEIGARPSSGTDSNELGDGAVYMLKLGKAYKIGKSFDVPRRHRQISLELPQKPDVVHSIRTDDPNGIEAYWHRRFEKKRTNGEWFALDGADVKAFKRRKFM
ncbi:MAG: GIY-YIG nuclease family protein [Aquabacterium sp.]